MRTDPIKKLVYKCPVCHEQITFSFNTQAHKRNKSLQTTGLGHYFDVHYSEVYGMHEVKLSIDSSLSIRGVYPVTQFAKLDDSDNIMPSNAGFFVKQDLPSQYWKYWSWLSIASSTHQLIVTVGSSHNDLYLESPNTPRQDNQDFIWDRVISTGASVTIDWLSDPKDNDRLFYWMFQFSEILQGAATITLTELNEALKYIDERGHHKPSEKDFEILRILLDMDTGIIKISTKSIESITRIMEIIKFYVKFEEIDFHKIQYFLEQNVENGFTIDDLLHQCPKVPARYWAQIIYDLREHGLVKIYPSYLEPVDVEYTDNEFGLLF